MDGPLPSFGATAAAPPQPPPADRPRGWLRHIAALAHHRHSRVALGALAFADSSFLPVPPDLLLVPMVLFQRERLYLLLAICTIGSSLGAALGYLIGYQLWGLIGAPLVAFYGYTDQFIAFQHLVAVWGFWIIVAKAFTPIPFKIAAIAAGATAMDPFLFMLATVIGRTLHFAMVGAMLALCGEKLLGLIARYERRLLILSLVAVLVLAGFWLLK